MLHPFLKYYFLSRIKDILDFGRLPMQASFHRQAPPNTLRGSHWGDVWEVMDHHSIEELWIQMFGSFLLSKHAACVMLSLLQRCMLVQKSEKSSRPRIVEMLFLTIHNRILDVTAKHVRSGAHRATQSMCFCHQADCMP